MAIGNSHEFSERQLPFIIWSRCQLTSFHKKMKRIVIQFLDSNSLSKIPNIFSWQRRTGTKPTRTNFQHVGILVSETLSKKRMSGHPGCPKFRTFRYGQLQYGVSVCHICFSIGCFVLMQDMRWIQCSYTCQEEYIYLNVYFLIYNLNRSLLRGDQIREEGYFRFDWPN